MREPQVRNYLHPTVLPACLWGTFLTGDWYGRAQHTVSGANPGRVTRKQAEEIEERFSRTQVWFSAPENLITARNASSGGLTPSSGLCGSLHSRAQTHTYTIKNSKSEREREKENCASHGEQNNSSIPHGLLWFLTSASSSEILSWFLSVKECNSWAVK